MFLVAGIMKGVTEFHETIRAANILGWAGAFTGTAENGFSVFIGKSTVFDEHQAILPVIAKVVEVVKAAPLLLDQIPKTILAADQSILLGFRKFGVAFLADGELVQVTVRPAHDDLEASCSRSRLMLAGTVKRLQMGGSMSSREISSRYNCWSMFASAWLGKKGVAGWRVVGTG